MERQFTATVYIVDGDSVLLIYHKKLGKWLPPGGHIDQNETPPEAAIREAREETGLEIQLIPQENIWVDRWNAKSMERPYLTLLQEIPAYGNQPAHQHMDMTYIGRMVGGKLKENPSETNGISWFNLEQIGKLIPDVEIFEETIRVIKHILNSHLSDYNSKCYEISK